MALFKRKAKKKQFISFVDYARRNSMTIVELHEKIIKDKLKVRKINRKMHVEL